MENMQSYSRLILATQTGVDLETSWMEGYEKSKNSIIDPDMYNPYPANSGHSEDSGLIGHI